MSIQWNDDQLKAITGRNGTMLVSAAAGSGKTAVLVERVIRRLCDEENPCSIENLLIVTFTRAAAAQMKEKITAALRKKVTEEPENKRLRKSLFMLPYANISTIDSFCINLVRDNYHSLDLSPDFQILDGTREEQMKSATVTAVVNEFHETRGEEFRYLNALINSVKNDNTVIDTIKKLYETSRAYTFPRRYLENIRDAYDTPQPVSESVWGKAAIDSAIQYLKDLLATIERNIDFASSDPAYTKFYDQLTEDKTAIEHLLDTVFSHDWEAIREALISFSVNSRTASSKDVPKEINDYFKAVRAYARTAEDKKYPPKKLSYLLFSEEDHARATEKTAPAVATLIDAVFAYEEKLKELKSRANAYSFEDVLHFTLELLVRDDGSGTPVRTELAKRIAEDYDEILVDEYQDVSKAQDAIFVALSKDDKNRFMVGDVKQSIYGFRKAMPEVFIDLRKSMYDFDAVHYPARVDLSANYRSRKGITDTVNFIFSQLMTENAGGVDYGEREALNPCAPLPESKETCTEIYLLEDKEPQDQALFTANYIKNAIENKMQIAEGEGFRDARYSDFCILTSTKKSFSLYAETFRSAGIPLIIGSGRQLFEAPEVSFLISLLKVIDNPVNDVPLTAVMLSPVYGFTPDELSEMRIKQKKGSLWSCLNEYAASGNEKAARFIAELARLRRIAVNLPAGEFTQRIVDESGYRAIVKAMSDSELRIAAVERFITVAASYEETGVKGISAFVRFIDSVENTADGPEITPSLTDASNAVTMCTIHKSKGLEYPVVILCECEKGFNSSLSDIVLVSENTGLGMKYIENGIKYDTLARNAVKNEINRKEHSERLRVLYVALTRPKEKLIILSSCNNWENKLKTYAANAAKGVRPSEGTVLEMGSFSQMILTAMLKHPDAHLLRQLAHLDPSVRENCESRVSFELVRDLEPEEGAQEVYEETYACDPAFLAEIKERLSYEYPYNSLRGIIAKRIASDFEDDGFDPTYFASETPAFTNKTGLTPAQRGTATHRFMQYADYRRAVKDTAAELNRLVDENILTPEEGKAVDIERVHKFFVSSLADRILALPDDKVFKEYAFTVSLPLKEVYPDIPDGSAQDEVIIIQGVADCAFIEDGELVIVDYKTDSASSVSELAVRYAPQLSTYRKCLSLAFNMNVKETLVYSFRFGTQIEIK